MKDENCNCPGCVTSTIVNRIQDDLIALAGVEAIYNQGKPDPRLFKIRDMVVSLGEDILNNLGRLDEENQIGVPIIEGTPEFMALFPGLKRTN